ncbi:MAG: ParB N-terminal domain-containing protein [Nitrosopumilus sp.]|nr:ParB N-terminal domain-containing protein [Nitrosopumilus sp.]
MVQSSKKDSSESSGGDGSKLSVCKFKEITINEEYLRMVPRPIPDEYKALRESIQINGQQEPIILNSKGEILDGHTRFEILENLGRESQYTIKPFDDRQKEFAYIVECNLIRRQLNSYQKIELSFSLYETLRKKAQRGQKGKSLLSDSTRKVFSRQLGIGSNLAQKGLWLLKNADELTKTRLQNGTVTIGNAYQKLHSSKLRKTGIKSFSKCSMVKCPHCLQEMAKGELIKI